MRRGKKERDGRGRSGEGWESVLKTLARPPVLAVLHFHFKPKLADLKQLAHTTFFIGKNIESTHIFALFFFYNETLIG